jgi:hypothetical protein
MTLVLSVGENLMIFMLKKEQMKVAIEEVLKKCDIRLGDESLQNAQDLVRNLTILLHVLVGADKECRQQDSARAAGSQG